MSDLTDLLEADLEGIEDEDNLNLPACQFVLSEVAYNGHREEIESTREMRDAGFRPGDATTLYVRTSLFGGTAPAVDAEVTLVERPLIYMKAVSVSTSQCGLLYRITLTRLNADEVQTRYEYTEDGDALVDEDGNKILLEDES